MPYIYMYISRWYVINYARMVCQGEDRWKRDEHNLSCRRMNTNINNNNHNNNNTNNIYIYIYIYNYLYTIKFPEEQIYNTYTRLNNDV